MRRSCFPILAILAIGIGVGIGACSVDTSITEKLVIEMYGVADAPAGATGSFEPKSQTYTFLGVTLVPENSDSGAGLYTGDPVEVKIVNRPQIIYSRNISEYKAEVFESLTVSFDPTVTAASKVKEDHELTFESGDFSLTKSFTAEESKTIVVTVKVNWKNTVTRDTAADPPDTMSLPQLELDVSSR